MVDSTRGIPCVINDVIKTDTCGQCTLPLPAVGVQSTLLVGEQLGFVCERLPLFRPQTLPMIPQQHADGSEGTNPQYTPNTGK